MSRRQAAGRPCSRKRARFLRASSLLPLVFALLAALAPAAADAQTSELVSNRGQTNGSAAGVGGAGVWRAQAFTTGNNFSGYTLSSVDVEVVTGGNNLSVSINAVNNGLPGSVVHSLTAPAAGTGVKTFTAQSGATLAAGTTYFVVAQGGSSTLRTTSSNAEDSGKASGWSIANTGIWQRPAINLGWRNNSGGLLGHSLEITVRGTLVSPPLVGNLGQSAESLPATVGINDLHVAQRFTTGSNVGGYTFSGVRADIAVPSGDSAGTPRVRIHRVNSSGNPGNVVHTLTNPSFGAGTEFLAAPAGATLAAGTSYFVVFEETTGAAARTFDVPQTRRDAEDAGGAAGWSIADALRHKLGSGPWSDDTSGNALKIEVHGEAVMAGSDTTAPSLSTTVLPSVNGASLVLTYDEALDTAHVPAASAFTVTVADSTAMLADTNPVAISGSAVTLTLASPVTPGQTVTVSYRVPAAEANRLQDAATNEAAALNNQAVRNDTRGIVYTGTFAEAAANDGSVDGTVTATLFGDMFTAGVVSGNHVSASGVPTGLTASFTRTSATVVTLTLTGTASAHAHANDVSNLGITFADGAFEGGSASAVNGSSKGDIAIDFADAVELSISATTTEITEGDTATVKVTATAAPASDLTVNYDVAGGTNFGVAQGVKTVVLGGSQDDRERRRGHSGRHDGGGGSAVRVSDSRRHRLHGGRVRYHPVHSQDDDDTTAPSLSTTTPPFVNGAALVLTYDEALDTGSVPATSAFTVSGTGRTVSNVAVSGSAVTLTVSPAVAAGETVTVSYTKGSNPIQDAVGNDAGNLSNRAVTNRTPGVLLSRTSLTVDEGGSGTYTVALASLPSDSVTVRITSDNADVTIDDTDANTGGVQNALTFTTSNWSTAQTVTVRAGEDDDGTNDSAALTHAIDGATEYANLSDPTVTVTVTDDDATGNQPPPAPSVQAQFATVGVAFSYQFDEVTDPEADGVTYAATLTDGSALSTVWLTFDPATRTFGGTPASGDVGTLSVRATATDDGTPSMSASRDFTITVEEYVPGNFRAQGLGGKIRYTWDAPRAGDVGGYEIRYSQDSSFPGGSTDTAVITDTAATRHDQAGLTNDTVYYSQIRVKNSLGTFGPWSYTLKATPAGLANREPPDAPSAPTVTAGTGELTVTWSEPADNGNTIIAYHVRHIRSDATNKANDDAWVDPRGTEWRIGRDTAFSYTISDLTAGVGYDVQVRAGSSNGDGDWSATATGTPTAVVQPATGSITWAGGFTEAAANTGSVAGTSVTATLTGDTFTQASGRAPTSR